MKDIEEILRIWTNEFEEALKVEYRDTGRSASGRWAKDMNTQINNIGNDKIEIKVTSTEYSQAMLYGRKPGKKPPLDAIKDWIKEKNIKPYDDISEDSLAFLIQRSIGENGNIAPTFYNSGNLVQNVYNEQVDGLKRLVIGSILSDVRESFDRFKK